MHFINVIFFVYSSYRKTCTDVPDKLLIVSRKKDIRVRQLISKNSLNEHDMVSAHLFLVLASLKIEQFIEMSKI